MTPTTLPTPQYMGPGHYWCPSFDMKARERGEGYDIRLEEMGWRCYCLWCANPYACKHTERLADYLLEQDIIDALPEAKSLSPAQRFMAEGGSLESLYDQFYANPTPHHAVTNRTRVRAR